MDYSCGSCIHCVDRHGSYRTNDGVCLRVGVTVRKGEKHCRPCGVRWSEDALDFIPGGFEGRDAS